MYQSIYPSTVSIVLLFILTYGSLMFSAFLIKVSVNDNLIKILTNGVLFITGLFLTFILYRSLFGYIEVTGNNVKIRSFGSTYSFNNNEIYNKENINLKTLKIYRTNGVAFLSFKAGEFKDRANKKYVILSNNIDNQKFTVADVSYVIPASIAIKIQNQSN